MGELHSRLWNDISDLDEIARLLWLARSMNILERKRIPTYEIRAMCMQYSGINAKSPNPDAAFRLLTALGLATIRGPHLALTSRGYELLAVSTTPAHMNTEQRGLLLQHLVADARWHARFVNVMRLFRKAPGGVLKFYGNQTELSELDLSCLRLFQYLGAVYGLDGSLVLRQESIADLGLSLAGHLPLTPDQYRELLERRNALGEAAERYIVEWERRRLAAVGLTDLESLVVRVSEFDIGRGYDIMSVDGPGSPDSERFIEVKGGSASGVSFHVSENELTAARRLGNRYWVYYVPNAGNLPGSLTSPCLFQNPFSELLRIWRVSSESYAVSLGNSTLLSRTPVAAPPSPEGWIMTLPHKGRGSRTSGVRHNPFSTSTRAVSARRSG